MAIYNPKLLPTKERYTYINCNICWFSKPTSIWYPLIRKWNDSTYSIGWNNFHHINLRPFNQLVSISNLEHVEPPTISTIVWQDTTYQQGTWPTRLVLGPSERSQVPHHKLISKGNQNVGTLTCSYCQHVGHLFNRCPFVDVRLR